VNTKDAQTIAARGYLLSLPFDNREIRERLLRAHRVYGAVRLLRSAQSRI
jgi:hypothetical protein